MLRHKLRALSILIAGTAAVGIGNFMVFVYFYKAMCADHLTEYWRTVHGGRMFDEVLPSYLLLALIYVGILIVAATRLLGAADRGSSANQDNDN